MNDIVANHCLEFTDDVKRLLDQIDSELTEAGKMDDIIKEFDPSLTVEEAMGQYKIVTIT